MKLALLIAVLLATTALADPPNDQPERVEIPLDRIWAYNMPGTRQMTTAMRGRPPKYVSPEGPLVMQIRRSLNRPLDEGIKAERGFAVLGRDMDALRQVHRVLVEKKRPRATFPVGSEITAIFFSYGSGIGVHIDEVERRGNIIEVQYRLNPYMHPVVAEHLALVPLGKLPIGKHQVKITQLPKSQKFVDEGYPRLNPELGQQIVSQDFSFVVEP